MEVVSEDATDLSITEIALDDKESILSAENTTKSNILQEIGKFAKDIAKEIQNDPNHGYLLLSIAMFLIWGVYIILYNARIQGYIVTAVLRRFYKKGDLKIGSVSISLLWGKLMFREIVYITEDYSFRVVDAIIQFHFWLPYMRKKLSEDMSKCDHRLWIELNGPELHIYNRSRLYSELEQKFGLESQIFPNKDCDEDLTSDGPVKDMSFWHSWRDLIPVIKIDLNMARVVFGNRLIPSTLLVTMDKAECLYSTKPAASPQDYFMHVIKSKAENFRVILAPSPKYTGILDEPPRFMGEGFVVMSSNKVQFYYYMDETGIVPSPLQGLLIPNSDESSQPPVWGIDIKCEKGTNLCYGPWADRQREQLFKFFFPQDYQVMEVSQALAPGEIRKAHQFDVRLSILQEATIDILFSKEKETNAVHMTCQRGTYFEMTLPWVVKKDGFAIRINGQFLYLDAATSLQYRNLIEAESFKYEICVKFPLIWNRHQRWDMNFSGAKATYHFLYAHKQFFHDLIEDWTSKVQPDIMHFVPYSWNFHINFKLFELITLANEYNWVDCSSQHQSNAHVAICGDYIDLNFCLPFTNFLPEVIPLKFFIEGKILYLSLFLPEFNTTRSIIESLDQNAKYDTDNANLFSPPVWRKFCKLGSGWTDCWHVPAVELNLGYTFHPMPPVGPSPQANVSTPEKMEILLSPIRAPKKKKTSKDKAKIVKSNNLDATSLPADTFYVELHIVKSSEIKLFGSILRFFIHLKENIFGENQKFIDMSEPSAYDVVLEETAEEEVCKQPDENIEEFDDRKYRPFEVTVLIDIKNVRGHLMKNCTESDMACPTISLDGLIFEMDKQHQETKMQVVLSPLILSTYDNASRNSKHSHLQRGFLVLSGLQMRGHAMFSDEDRQLGDETLEYSWLVELTVGSLSGKLTTPQLHHVITGLDTFIFAAVDNENCLRHPRPYNLCYHGDPQPDCMHTLPDHYCPTVDIIKYKMLRVSVDGVDFHLVEVGADLNLQIYPIRISTCNLHGQHTRSGITAHIENVKVRNYVCGRVATPRDSRYSTEIGGGQPVNDTWIEAAVINLGPLYIDAAVSSNVLYHDMQLIQHNFLNKHDVKTKRLWFLWPVEVTKISKEVFGKCGCVGGCSFIGDNRNGPRFFKPSKQDFAECLNVAQFRLNMAGVAPGYGQSILQEEQLVFDACYSSSLTQCRYGSVAIGEDQQQLHLSSGYTKSVSPAIDLHNTLNASSNNGGAFFSNKNGEKFIPSRASQDIISKNGDQLVASQDMITVPVTRRRKSSSTNVTSSHIGASSSLGRQNKDVSKISVPPPVTGESITSPGSLTDLSDHHPSPTDGSSKLFTSLSLQADLSVHSSKQNRNGRIGDSPQDNDRSSITSKESPLDNLSVFKRTVSVGSEALSEVFFSADEDQIHNALSRRGTSISPASSQISLPPVPEHKNASIRKDSSTIFFSPKKTKSTEYLNNHHSRSRSNSSSSSSSSSCQSSSSSTGTCDYRSGVHGHSQTSLLHSSGSNTSLCDELNFRPTVQKPKKNGGATDFFSEVGSVSSNSFISAVSSQEDIGLVNLHMQLNKPITESPLLMSSYINHMTQLRCLNWEAPIPSFETEGSSNATRPAPSFEKLSEGFTAIRMVEGVDYIPPCKSPLQGSNNTPNHPYSWDTPVFTWGDKDDNATEDADEIVGGGLSDSNTTRTTVVMKLKKDVDLTISPIALESTQRFLDALAPIMESLHPLTIVNRTHFRSMSNVEGKNTLKKDRYMYWSRLRDNKKSGTPEQGPVVTSTYHESCFQQIQGQISIPRVNFTLLQASVVEEIISFSALDNIRDLTCVSIFSFCLDSVNLQFYSGHQSNQAVQIFMRNPRVPGKPKKLKSKMKKNVDLFAEPVYIETSEKQQEENMISVSVNKVHVQLRRLKNESSLLKDASITAIPDHRSKVMFAYRRCSHDDTSSHSPNEERMGFIMFEAGLENVILKAVKRKGFDVQSDTKGTEGATSRVGSTTGHSSGTRRESTVPPATSTNNGNTNNNNGTSTNACRTNSLPIKTKTEERSAAVASANNDIGSVPPPTPSTAPPTCSSSTPFTLRKSTSSSAKHDDNVSPSQGSSATGHSADVPLSAGINKEVSTPNKNDKKDITSFFVELSTVWLNFAAPPHTPITKKIDYTRLDWNFLSTASPSINAWMNPSDRLTVAIINFLHSSETRRLGVIASLMAEALEMPSIHIPPKSKYLKLMPLSQTIQEDPSCQLCNALRRYILQGSLKHIESNLTHNHLPKLATLRQSVVVLSRQWKSALYMPLLMEQTFKYKQSKPAYAHRSASTADAFTSSKIDPHKIFEEKISLLHDMKDASPLSNIEEGIELKDGFVGSEGECTDGVLSSMSSHIPPRHSLPSFPPRSSTASAILPASTRTQLESSPRRFQFPNFGLMFEETLNYFRSTSPKDHQEWKNSVPDLATQKTAEGEISSPKIAISDECLSSVPSDNENEVESPRLPREDFYKWMARQQEHTLQSKSAVTFNKVSLKAGYYLHFAR